MLIDKSFCITSKDIINNYNDKSVYIWGTGDDAEHLYTIISDKVEIEGFIDSYRYGYYFHNKLVLDGKEINSFLKDDCLVVIASYKKGIEILSGIEGKDLVVGNNFFLYDDAFIFHENQDIKEYISFNKKVWEQKKVKNPKTIILAPFFNIHDGMSIIYAFFANRMAEKYNGRIIGYIERGLQERNLSDVMRNVYSSINYSEIMSGVLTELQKKRASVLAEELWKGINTWSDWKRIEVYGIEFGTTIIRYMNRFENPSINPSNIRNKAILEKSLQFVVYWYDYFEDNDIKVVFLKDGATWEGFIREIAIYKNIPTYALQGVSYYRRMVHDFYHETWYPYYKGFWKELSAEEQRDGIDWAKRSLNDRLRGSVKEIPYLDGKTAFLNEFKTDKLLRESDNLKVLVCPHIFGEDEYACGEQIFDNNYISWLVHIGELSEMIKDYDWYLKPHPYSGVRDYMIINQLVKKYPRITVLPLDASPWQLKEEGVDVVLTVYGSVGEEYPAMGVPVINAGKNAHMMYSFNYTPSEKEEFDRILRTFNKEEYKIDIEELYSFYALNYYYYDWDKCFFSYRFFGNDTLYSDRFILQQKGKDFGPWIYKEYMLNWSEEKQIELYEDIDEMIKEMDEWDESRFYRRR